MVLRSPGATSWKVFVAQYVLCDDHVFDNLLAQLVVFDFGIVLHGDDHGVDPHGFVIFIFDGDLALAVGADPGEFFRLPQTGQALHQPVGQMDRQRHQYRGFFAGVSEH